MSYYSLPHISKTLDIDNLNIQFTADSTTMGDKISFIYISTLKKEIEKYIDKWDIYKKYTNTYEYIHSQVPSLKISVSKYKPLSRSYFKFIEISNIFKLLPDIFTPIKSFHLCEGPGGFIEAIANLRMSKDDTYYGMTLVNTDENTPGWKKSSRFLKLNQNVKLEYGEDGTGNIINSKNFIHCYNTYKNSFDILTGDGGFDFSVDFNNQENICNKLILGQILYAIAMQKYNGSFVLKIFDMFSKSTMEFVYFLSLFYNKVYIFKPQTSRHANSEKYIICKNFKLISSVDYINIFNYMIKQLEASGPTVYIQSVFKQNLPYFYTIKLDEISHVLCQFQINVIHNTISLIKHNKTEHNGKIDDMIKLNTNKCIQWCIKHNVPYNKLANKV